MFALQKPFLIGRSRKMMLSHWLIVSFVLMLSFDQFFFLRERDHGGVGLPVHCEAFQDVQGQEVPLHADGVLPRWRALDHPQVRFKKLLFGNSQD